MLEGLEISVINFKDIDLGDRIDAEYFQRSDLKVVYTLKRLNVFPLSKYGKFVASAFYPAATNLYESGDIPFIRCVDCINYPLISREQDSIIEKIPLQFVELNKGVNTLKKNDIIITKVGSPCFASLLYEHEYVALSRTVLGMYNIKNIDPFYLIVFLRSKYGFSQLLRQRELTIQYQLTLDRVKKIYVYEPEWNFQIYIHKLLEKQIEKLKDSIALHSKAESLLLKELGLNDWKPTKDTAATKTLNDYKISGRLDAEYYQPKYDELFQKLFHFVTKRLGDIVNIVKSIEPGSEAYQKEGIPFIRVANLTKFGISGSDVYLDESYSDENLNPKKDTILLTKDGSVGIAYKVEEDLKIITSGAILHLYIKDKSFKPDYLTLVLNSIIVKMQAERDAGGSIIQHWKPNEIENVVVPKLPENIQMQIVEKIQQSFILKTESQKLLELAKTAVEIAIEQGEEQAIKLINTGYEETI